MNAHAAQIGAIARAALAPCERSAWTPRQPCVSQATLGLVRLRRHVQRILRFTPHEYWAWTELATGLPHHMPTYAPAGVAWAEDVAALRDAGVEAAARAEDGLLNAMGLALAGRQFLDDSLPKLRAALRQDRADLLDGLSEDIAEDIETRQAHLEWAHLNVQLHFGGLPPRKAGAGDMASSYKTTVGKPIETAEGLASARLQTYADKERAAIQTPDEAAATYNEKAPPGATGPEPHVDDIPTLPALGRSSCSGALDKAAGDDGLGSSAFKAAPRALARLYRPLCAKVALRGQEPLLWERGIAVGIPKPGAPGGDPGAARKIELGTAVSKCRRAFLGGRLSQAIKRIYFDTQLGCRKHGSCALATQMGFIFLAIAAAAPRQWHDLFP